MDRRGFLARVVVAPLAALVAPLMSGPPFFDGQIRLNRYVEIVHQFGPGGVGYGPVSGLEAMAGPQQTFNGITGSTLDAWDWREYDRETRRAFRESLERRSPIMDLFDAS